MRGNLQQKLYVECRSMSQCKVGGGLQSLLLLLLPKALSYCIEPLGDRPLHKTFYTYLPYTINQLPGTYAQ